MINPLVFRDAENIRESFTSAKPFRFFVIDNFLEPIYAEKLLRDFPQFDPRNAINEFGQVGGKAVVERIDEISPFYREVYNYIKSGEFLDIVTALTGIADLIPDPGSMYGGGTHENVEGQELDPHVDFNYLDPYKLHRRLNMLIFLNKEWQANWGGSVELHSDPRNPNENTIQEFLPLFNRCVTFETNEYSWHGFRRIQLPPEQKHLSRKSLSIYLYTRERPTEEVAPRHATFYVQRPLPSHIRPGCTLTSENFQEISRLIVTRDRFIEFYQKKELADSSMFQETLSYLESVKSQVRLPLTGYVLQNGAAQGHWADDWISPSFRVTVTPQQPVSKIVLSGFIPEMAPLEMCLNASIDGQYRRSISLSPGLFEWPLAVPTCSVEALTLAITSQTCFNPKRAGVNEDDRDLLFRILELRFLHF